MWYPILITVLVGYLLGNLNGSVSISTLLLKEDVREHGSGNAGLTNFHRNYGGWATLLVALVDMSKTILSCLVGGLMLAPYNMSMEGRMLGAVAVSLGHDFPVLLGFKGGKGILSGFAISIALDWRVAVIIFAVFAVVYGITKYVSLGSVLSSAAFSVAFAVLYRDNYWIIGGSVLLGALAIFMHRANIVRLLTGKESKVYLLKKKA